MLRNYKPDLSAIEKLISSLVDEGSREQKLSAATKSTVVKSILEAIKESQQRAFPDYIELVLRSRGFHLRFYQDEKQSGCDGQYFGFQNRMCLLPPQPEKAAYFVKQVLPHEFWHAYITILRAENHDAVASVRGKSPTVQTLANAPYGADDERAKFEASLSQGMKRVAEYRELLQKRSADLSDKDKAALALYNAATVDYQPIRRETWVEARTAVEKSQAVLSAFSKQGQMFMHDQQFIFYPDGFRDVGDKIAFTGFFVDKPNDPEKRGMAFAQDTLYAQFDLTVNQLYHRQGKHDQGHKKLTFNTESDAYLAPNSKKIFEAFFPELLSYHQALRKKHLARMPTKHLMLFKVYDEEFPEATPLRTSQSVLFFSPSPRNWEEACKQYDTLRKDEQLSVVEFWK